MKSYIFALLLAFSFVLLTACSASPQASPATVDAPQYLTVPPDALPTHTPGPTPTPITMKIKGKQVLVDKVVEGPLCNDTWSGTIYVSKNIQIYPWKKSPDFLRNCNLTITPGTVVYVAHHRDAAYYNGCSCHADLGTKP